MRWNMKWWEWQVISVAVIKHIASKNADYGESERYLIFQHNEYTQKPILDDEGHMILRDEYYLDGLNCDPFTFASECQELNSYYHKNKKFLFMIQLSEHWKKNLSEISCLPRNPSMLKKTDLLNCEICNGKIFLTAGIMNGSFVPCLPILIWSLGRATNRNSRLRKNRIYKFPVFMLSKKRYYIKKRRRYKFETNK